MPKITDEEIDKINWLDANIIKKWSNRKNLSGKKFSRLRVTPFHYLYTSKNNSRYICWLCKCNCGNKTVVRSADLSNGFVKSCGCYCLEQVRISNHKKYTGNQYISGELASNYIKGARERGILCLMNREDIIKFTEDRWMNQRGLCFFCGVSLKTRTKRGKMADKNCLSIDRIVNDKNIGYIKDNLRLTCSRCNMFKKNIDEEDFLFMIKNIYEHKNLGAK